MERRAGWRMACVCRARDAAASVCNALCDGSRPCDAGCSTAACVWSVARRDSDKGAGRHPGVAGNVCNATVVTRHVSVDSSVGRGRGRALAVDSVGNVQRAEAADWAEGQLSAHPGVGHVVVAHPDGNRLSGAVRGHPVRVAGQEKELSLHAPQLGQAVLPPQARHAVLRKERVCPRPRRRNLPRWENRRPRKGKVPRNGPHTPHRTLLHSPRRLGCRVHPVDQRHPRSLPRPVQGRHPPQRRRRER